jgi:hypothetical protein
MEGITYLLGAKTVLMPLEKSVDVLERFGDIVGRASLEAPG